MLSHLILLILFAGACCELHDGSGEAKFRLVPQFLCKHMHVFRTHLIIEYGFSCNFIAALILINLYS